MIVPSIVHMISACSGKLDSQCDCLCVFLPESWLQRLFLSGLAHFDKILWPHQACLQYVRLLLPVVGLIIMTALPHIFSYVLKSSSAQLRAWAHADMCTLLFATHFHVIFAVVLLCSRDCFHVDMHVRILTSILSDFTIDCVRIVCWAKPGDCSRYASTSYTHLL